jgi:hypothetical protein
MRAQVTCKACSKARPVNARPLAAWRASACAIDRSFVVIRLKHPAV